MFVPTHRYLNIRTGEWVPVRVLPWSDWTSGYLPWPADRTCDCLVETADGRRTIAGRVFVERLPS